jgi:hypothetical protein
MSIISSNSTQTRHTAAGGSQAAVNLQASKQAYRITSSIRIKQQQDHKQLKNSTVAE